MTLSDMRAIVRRDLRDEVEQNYRWTDDEIDRHIARAVAAFSQALPQELKDDIATTPDSREIDISAITGLFIVYAVEYPIGYFPPIYNRFSLYQSIITLLGEYVPDGSDARIFYGGPHTLLTYPAWVDSADYGLGVYVLPTTPNGYYYKCTTAGTSGATQPTWPITIGATVYDNTVVWTCEAVTSTIHPIHHDTIATGAAAFALLEYAAYIINRVNVGGVAAPGDFRTRGEELLRHFNDNLRRLKLRLRATTLYTPAMPPVSKSTDWGPEG